MDWIPSISHIVGWTYFAAWSASFYPQAYLNYKRKSVQGLSIDFLFLNVVGFLCYSIFNLSFFYSPEVQEEYRRRNGGQDNLVRFNDVFFAVHALVLSSFTLCQSFIYKRDQNQDLARPTIVLIGIIAFGSAIVGSSAVAGRTEWIDLLYYLSYIKLGISFIKYCPQIYINFSAKSTRGWSIHNILLDFMGGALSIAQLLLDSFYSGDWSGITGDPVKFGLGFVSIAFDLIFMVQHYILYRHSNRAVDYIDDKLTEGEYQPLLTATNNGSNYQTDKPSAPRRIPSDLEAAMNDKAAGVGSSA